MAEQKDQRDLMEKQDKDAVSTGFTPEKKEGEKNLLRKKKRDHAAIINKTLDAQISNRKQFNEAQKKLLQDEENKIIEDNQKFKELRKSEQLEWKEKLKMEQEKELERFKALNSLKVGY